MRYWAQVGCAKVADVMLCFFGHSYVVNLRYVLKILIQDRQILAIVKHWQGTLVCSLEASSPQFFPRHRKVVAKPGTKEMDIEKRK